MNNVLPLFGLLLLTFTMTAFAAPTTDISGIWGMATLQGDLNFISPDLTSFQWLISSQTGEREDSAKGLRLNEAILLGQVGYQVNKHVTFWLGYLDDRIHPLNKLSYEESRPYQDVVYTQTVADFNLTIRTRLEERINQANSDIGYRVKQFFQINHALPFIDGLSGYLNNDTYFYVNQTNFGKQGFSENRFGSGLSYQFTKQLGADLGYLQQYVDNKTGSNLLINNLQMNLRYRF
ncbi:MAG: DUF2490 domain-containing protein [Methylococcaceae bacterium]